MVVLVFAATSGSCRKLLSLVPLLCCLLLHVSSVYSQQYPNCPVTGKQPHKTSYTYTRCVEAKEYSCCQDCFEYSNSLVEKTANSTLVLSQILPGASNVLAGKDYNTCQYYAGHRTCEIEMEQLTCALMCNPDSGNYMVMDSTGKLANFSICDGYAAKMFSDCEELEVPGIGLLKNLFPSKGAYFKVYVEQLNRISVYNHGFNITVVITPGTQGCYNGPTTSPDTNQCCDPLSDIPTDCFPSPIDLSQHPDYKAWINKTELAPTCTNHSALAPTSSPSSSPPSSTTKTANAGVRLPIWLCTFALSVWLVTAHFGLSI